MKTFLCGLLLILTLQITLKAEPPNVVTGMGFKSYLDLCTRQNRNLTREEWSTVHTGDGFLLGFLQTYGQEVFLMKREPIFRLPNNITLGQIVLIMDKYTKQHPEQLNLEAIQLIYLALTEAYPNPKFKML